MTETYTPVTIITEDEHGRMGVDEHECQPMTEAMIIARCKVLSEKGWEPIEIQVNESQWALELDWWSA